MISLMIVDDHPMVREGLAAMLESERDFVVSALAATGEEAVAIGKLAKPDIVMSDIRMPGIDGFGVLAKLKEIHPDIRVKGGNINPDRARQLDPDVTELTVENAPDLVNRAGLTLRTKCECEPKFTELLLSMNPRMQRRRVVERARVTRRNGE